MMLSYGYAAVLWDIWGCSCWNDGHLLRESLFRKGLFQKGSGWEVGVSLGVEFLTSDRIKETESLQRSAWENTASVSHTDSGPGLGLSLGGGIRFLWPGSLTARNHYQMWSSQPESGTGLYQHVCVFVLYCYNVFGGVHMRWVSKKKKELVM